MKVARIKNIRHVDRCIYTDECNDRNQNFIAEYERGWKIEYDKFIYLGRLLKFITSKLAQKKNIFNPKNQYFNFFFWSAQYYV